MDYQFNKIEQKWQAFWAEHKPFKASVDTSKPKYYVLDMFPYPSGAGLHVGHPLGYIASDIVSRYKRLKGFNVLHPMGYDAFGLPAEQYAIQTGQHPSITTKQNIETYRRQLDQIGFSFDWDTEVKTSDPHYYKWTQWIFIQLFNSWYNKASNKAENINTLIRIFETAGNKDVQAVSDDVTSFSADEWKNFDEPTQQKILLHYRLAYLDETMVNWCPGLGTVLANEEVKDGFSERGGFPVEKKLMKQWSLRITAYADRLLNDLDKIDWPEPVKEMQRNWIGKSEGASLRFKLDQSDKEVEVFTTRPDTVFGCSFLVLAPEHEWVEEITAAAQKTAVEEYVTKAKNRSERDRMADVKNISGCFTGAYAIHPFNGKTIPIWIADYVLAGYGTGAVMAVPAHDSRDYAFAKHFQLPIIEVVAGGNISEESYDAKEGKLIDSDFLNGLEVKDAVKTAIKEIEKRGLGTGKTQYRLRDAGFSRQRYWGEPFPVYYKNDIPYMVDEADLPLILPEVDKYLPTESGEPPLARAKDWVYKAEKYPLETNTMPGWAGSSWYFLRYMDAQNPNEFVAKEAVHYWQDVDLYLGGAEHATGHLLYVRFWTKFLFDVGLIPKEEPAKKLINQGMIQGRSNFAYRVNGKNQFVSFNLKNQYTTSSIHVDVNIVENDCLNIDKFKQWRPEFANAEFILEDGKYICGSEVEKMSKSKWNVVNPDDIMERYGADTLRMYEMFLGPLEQSKPWNTNGIEGVFKFLRKFWKLFHDDAFNFSLSDEKPSAEELKSLHKIIKKVAEDIERFSFNTSISAFMICVNELTALKCNKRAILQELTIVLSPFAPHICEELWELLGNKKGSISFAHFPEFKEEYLTENHFEYPISINGKVKTKINFPLDMEIPELEKEILSSEEFKKYLDGKTPKKVIIVKGRIVNVVV